MLKSYKSKNSTIMKKFLSLVVVMLVAALSFNASAQSSKLVGKWLVDTSSLTQGVGGDIKFIIEFDSDRTGDMDIDMKMVQPIDGTTKMNIWLSMEVDTTWSLSDNTLTLKPVDIEIEIENLTVTPSNPQYDAYIPAMKQMMKQQFSEGKEQMVNGMAVGTSKVRFVDNNTMILIPDDGNAELVCKRVR